MIADVSSFDEAGAQLVRLDAHFQTDCRARRARLHHVLPFPRMRVLKGMWRSVAAGEGRGSTSRPIWAQLVQQFRKILVRKPRYPTTRASFLYSIAGCFSVVGRIPRSGTRSIRERPTTAPSAWDTSAFVPESVLRAVLFRAAVHCIRSASRLVQVECCPRYIGGSSDCWRLAFPTPFPDSWRAFKVRPRSYFGRLSSSSRKSNTDIVRIPSLS